MNETSRMVVAAGVLSFVMLIVGIAILLRFRQRPKCNLDGVDAAAESQQRLRLHDASRVAHASPNRDGEVASRAPCLGPFAPLASAACVVAAGLSPLKIAEEKKVVESPSPGSLAALASAAVAALSPTKLVNYKAASPVTSPIQAAAHSCPTVGTASPKQQTDEVSGSSPSPASPISVKSIASLAQQGITSIVAATAGRCSPKRDSTPNKGTLPDSSVTVQVDSNLNESLFTDVWEQVEVACRTPSPNSSCSKKRRSNTPTPLRTPGRTLGTQAEFSISAAASPLQAPTTQEEEAEVVTDLSPQELAILELLNNFSADDLLLVKGLGPKSAKAIVAWRQHGRHFERIEDLVTKVGLARSIANKVMNAI